MNNILNCCGYNEKDVNIIRGQGDCLYDDKGRKYIDFEAGVWCTSLGHSHGYSQAVNLLRFYPALIIRESSIDNMLEKLDDILKQ